MAGLGQTFDGKKSVVEELSGCPGRPDHRLLSRLLPASDADILVRASYGNQGGKINWPGKRHALRQLPAIRGVVFGLIIGVCVWTSLGCAGKQSGLHAPLFSPQTEVTVVRTIDNSFLQSVNAAEDVGGSTILEAPVTLAVTPDGVRVIADRQTGRILRIRPDGTIQLTSGTAGPSGLSTLRRPRFLRLDLIGNAYLSDAFADRVAVYDTRLRPLRDLAPPYDALQLAPGQITGIAFGRYGDLYMVDQFNRRVFHFDASGRFVNSFAGEQTPWARLIRPSALACAPVDGSVFVCDPGESRIVVFDNTGLPLRSFGEGDLRNPVAIAVDDRGQVFVADTEIKAIVVFTSGGRFLGRIDGWRLGLPDFEEPTDVALADSILCVADPSRGRILEIRLRPAAETSP